MSNFTLTMLDASGIQRYIFGSNRLQENIGASEIVYRATTLWAFEALNEERLENNVEIKNWKTAEWGFKKEKMIERDNALKAEVVYAGGGNTLIIFRAYEDALRFTRRLTQRLLKDAPGMALTVQHVQEFKWQSEKLSKKRGELLKALAKHKQSRHPSTPILGLGVTAVCESTGLPAARTNEGEVQVKDKSILLKWGDEEPRIISREILAKLTWRDFAQRRLKHFVGKSWRGDDFDFPSDIDTLGRVKGEESYVAVVHADGNRMGKHIDAIADRIAWQETDTGAGNREYVNELRNFSEKVNDASLAALESLMQRMHLACDWNEETKQWMIAKKVPIISKDSKYWLPFRPLVFGGDDVTFLCNARLGLTLATAYLSAFENEIKQKKMNPIHACAGVAMVKMHYPFARAYDLSEQLCNNAKKEYTRDENKPDSDCSALDWHFATSGLSGSLNAIRRREYFSDEGKELCMRPLRLRAEQNDQTGRYWENGIERIIREFQDGKEWAKRRNKVIGLRDVLRAGPQTTADYRRDFDLPLLPQPDSHFIPGNVKMYREKGWIPERCVYFDAIELLDHYVSLEEIA